MEKSSFHRNKQTQAFILNNATVNLYGCPHEGEFPSKAGDLGSLYNQCSDAKLCAKTGAKITNQHFKFRRLLSFVF